MNRRRRGQPPPQLPATYVTTLQVWHQHPDEHAALDESLLLQELVQQHAPWLTMRRVVQDLDGHVLEDERPPVPRGTGQR